MKSGKWSELLEVVGAHELTDKPSDAPVRALILCSSPTRALARATDFAQVGLEFNATHSSEAITFPRGSWIKVRSVEAVERMRGLRVDVVALDGVCMQDVGHIVDPLLSAPGSVRRILEDWDGVSTGGKYGYGLYLSETKGRVTYVKGDETAIVRWASTLRPGPTDGLVYGTINELVGETAIGEIASKIYGATFSGCQGGADHDGYTLVFKSPDFRIVTELARADFQRGDVQQSIVQAIHSRMQSVWQRVDPEGFVYVTTKRTETTG